jgi:hypothetical protein
VTLSKNVLRVSVTDCTFCCVIPPLNYFTLLTCRKSFPVLVVQADRLIFNHQSRYLIMHCCGLDKIQRRFFCPFVIINFVKKITGPMIGRNKVPSNHDSRSLESRVFVFKMIIHDTINNIATAKISICQINRLIPGVNSSIERS